MEKKFHLFHGEDNPSSTVSDFELNNTIDQAVADARDVCLTSSNIAVNQTFFMTSGFGLVSLTFAQSE